MECCVSFVTFGNNQLNVSELQDVFIGKMNA